MFLTLMVVGLAGLLVMALPALGRHGHVHPSHGHGGGTTPGLKGAGRGAAHGLARGGGRSAAVTVRGHGPAAGGANRVEAVLPADPAFTTLMRHLPSPRTICSVLALFGAFGNALLHGAHMTFVMAVVTAAVAAVLVERIAVRPVWNLLYRFQGQPSSSLDDLILTEARAVIAFRNGRGLVSAVRDGRAVQLSAQLRHDQAALPVKVGERLRIEDVDAKLERVTVSMLND